MRENFDRFFNLTVMDFEGGSRQTNDPDDPGGLTKYGISRKAYPDEDIAHLTESRAKELYKRDYWDKVNGDELPYPWDMIMADAAVNCGVSRAKHFKEMCSSPEGFHMGRIFYYKTLVDKKPNMQKYFRGWVNRVMRLWIETKQ